MMSDWEAKYLHRVFEAAKEFRRNLDPDRDTKLFDELCDATAAAEAAIDGPRT